MSTTLSFVFADGTLAGRSLVAIILDGRNRCWDQPTRTFAFPPRTAGVQIALTEETENPGRFHPTGPMPPIEEGQSLYIRIEEAGDASRTPVGGFTVRSTEVGVRFDFSDVLDAIVHGSGVDGYEDDRWSQVLVDLLSSGAGTAFGKAGHTILRKKDRDGRRALIQESNRIGGGTTRRRVLPHADPLQAGTIPPDAFRLSRAQTMASSVVFPSPPLRPASLDTSPVPPPPPPPEPPPVAAPVVILQVTPDAGTVPLVVQATAIASGATGPYQFAFNWGDGFTDWSSASSAAHAFATAGTVTIQAKARDALGVVSAVVERTVTAIALPTPPSITFDLDPDQGAVTFTVTASLGATGGTGASTFRIDWGDGAGFGAFSSDTEPRHTYTAADTYTVRAQAKDALGLLSSIATHQVVATAGVPAPAPSITGLTISADHGTAPLAVTVTIVADHGTAPLEYAVDWGEGAGFGAFSSSTTPSHTYTAAGTFTLRVQAKDALGALSPVASRQIVAQAPAPPVVGLVVAPSSGVESLDVVATATASGGVGPYTYAFDFGSGFGAYGSSSTAAHTFASAGSYTVRVIAKDSRDFTSAIATQAVTVLAVPVASVSVTPSGGVVPLDVTATISAFGGTFGPYEYRVDWGAGDGFGDWLILPAPTHTYPGTGTYQVRAQVRDVSGTLSAVASQQVVVSSAPPAPNPEVTLAVSADVGVTPFTVTATLAASSGTGPYLFSINWGDGGGYSAYSSSTTPSHTYTSAGTFTVQARAKDALTNVSTVASHVMTVASPPVAALAISPTTGAKPLVVAATITATSGVAPYTVAVDWGEGAGFGAFGTVSALAHTFAAIGTYTVRAQVKDANGTLSAIVSQTVTAVAAPSPSVTLAVSSSSGTAPLATTATLTAAGGTTPYLYWADFGDGPVLGVEFGHDPYAAAIAPSSLTGIAAAVKLTDWTWGESEALPLLPTPQYNLANFDAEISSWIAAGFTNITVVLRCKHLLATAPTWTPPANTLNPLLASQPPASEAYWVAVGRWYGALATRYRGRVKRWEIESELDRLWNGTVDDYLRLLDIAYRAIKAADPAAIVVAAGINWDDILDDDPSETVIEQRITSLPEDWELLARRSQAMTSQILAAGSYDAVEFHALTAASGIVPTARRLRTMLRPGAELWAGDAFPNNYVVWRDRTFNPPKTKAEMDAFYALLQAGDAGAKAQLLADQVTVTTAKIAAMLQAGLDGMHLGPLVDWPLISGGPWEGILESNGSQRPVCATIRQGVGPGTPTYGSSSTATHTYTDPGVFTVRGQVMDAAGALSPIASTVVTVAAPAPPPPPIDTTYTIRVGLLTRTYGVHLPNPLPTGAIPAVIACHPGGTNAAFFARESGWSSVADQNGFAVIYPEGTPAGSIEAWNAWVCCGSATQLGVDDIGFLSAMIDELPTRFNLDRSRVYVTGFSNGGNLAERMAAMASTKIAAAAGVSGALTTLDAAVGPPIPVLHIHGMVDTHEPYAGGPGPNAIYPFPALAVESQVMPFFAARNGCSTTPTVTARTGYDILTYPGGLPTVLYRLTNIGHVYNSGLFVTSQVIWQFFAPLFIAPRAVLTATPASGTAPLGVVLSAAGSTAASGTLTYAFDYGEGAGFGAWQALATSNHAYAAAGTFTARLKVRDAQGRESAVVQTTVTVVAANPEPPTVDATPRNRHAVYPLWARSPSPEPTAIAELYSLLIVGAGTGTGKVNEVKTACQTAGLTFRAAWYQKAPGVHDDALVTNTPDLTFGFQSMKSQGVLALRSCGDGTSYVRNSYSNPRWYYTQVSGSCNAGAPAIWLANQLALAASMRARVRMHVYLDNVGILLSSFSEEGLPAGYTDAGWWAGIVNHVAGIRAGTPSDLEVYVNVYVGTSGVDFTDVLPHVTGVFLEGASWKDNQTGAPDYFTAVRYRSQISMIRTMLAYGGGRVVVMIEDFTSTAYDRRIFRLATFLLCWDGTANLKEFSRVHDTNSDIDYCVEYDQPVTDLGAPVGTVQDDGNILSRQYQNGWIFTNPDDTSHTLTIPAGSWLALGLVGGTAYNDATKGVAWSPISAGPMALSPHTAVVLKITPST